MRLSRLLSIVILLLERNRVTARELAQAFEVSVRTVYRDLEAINEAGIPVLTAPGKSGGITLAEGYSLDGQILTGEEAISLKVALQSYLAAYPDIYAEKVLQKLESHHRRRRSASPETVWVDLPAQPEPGTLKTVISLLRTAVKSGQQLSFHYPGSGGIAQTHIAEPYFLVYKNWIWFVGAYCRNLGSFRFFRLDRITGPAFTGAAFVRQPLSSLELPWQQTALPEAQDDAIWILLAIAEGQERYIAGQIGSGNLFVDEDGHCLALLQSSDNEHLYRRILGWGAAVEVLHPIAVRQKMLEYLKKITHAYQNHDKQLSTYFRYNGDTIT